MTDILSTIYDSVLEGNMKAVSEGVQKAVDEKKDLMDMIEKYPTGKGVSLLG